MKLIKPRRPNATRVREALSKRPDRRRATLRIDDRERAARKRVIALHAKRPVTVRLST
jgi:hypothetical protein